MGVGMEQVEANFFIPKEHVEEVKLALQDLFSSERISLVDQEVIERLDDLSGILIEARWSPEFDDDGNVSGIKFIGEKLQDDKKIFDTIAKYVKDGSSIEMVDQWDGRWTWEFVDGICQEQKH